MTTVIRKATSADLLAALPALVGRDPRQSVVLIAFRGKRTHAALRFAFPKAGVKRFTATAVGMFCTIPGVEDVVPVICSEDPLGTHHELTETLVRRFRQAGFAVRDALVVASDGWGSHFDPDGRAHPLVEIEEAAARLALDPPAPLPEPLADLPFFAEHALEWTDAELSDRGALLLLALQGPPARDLVMLQWAFGLELGNAMWSGDTCAGIEARKVYPDADSVAADLMLGRGPSPDVDRIERAASLLTTLISRAENADRLAPLCMLAWLAWARGRGSAAGVHIDEVRAISPDYSMGRLLDTLFSTGAMPEWIFTAPDADQLLHN